jgi:hypothetical protein
MGLGSGISDPRSGKYLSRNRGSKRHRIPGSGSATQQMTFLFLGMKYVAFQKCNDGANMHNKKWVYKGAYASK